MLVSSVQRWVEIQAAELALKRRQSHLVALPLSGDIEFERDAPSSCRSTKANNLSVPTSLATTTLQYASGIWIETLPLSSNPAKRRSSSRSTGPENWHQRSLS